MHLPDALGLDIGHGHTHSVEPLPRARGVNIRQAHIAVDLNLGLGTLDARSVLDPVLELGRVLILVRSAGVGHDAELQILNRQVLDVAIEAELDPCVATPPHLREGDRVRDRVEERAEVFGAHDLSEIQSGRGMRREWC